MSGFKCIWLFYALLAFLVLTIGALLWKRDTADLGSLELADSSTETPVGAVFSSYASRPDCVTVAIATYNRIVPLKLFIPRYLAVPLVGDIVISDDYGSNDADALRAWLPTSGLSPADQSRVHIYSNTSTRLLGLRNKVRALGYAGCDWAALVDSDNYASPEHYWGPLAAYWNTTYGSAPPPRGTFDAERRSINPPAWMITNELLKPGNPGRIFSDFWRFCTRDGGMAEPNSQPDPLVAVGRDCWESIANDYDTFVSVAWLSPSSSLLSVTCAPILLAVKPGKPRHSQADDSSGVP